jgi:hypothetical protein
LHSCAVCLRIRGAVVCWERSVDVSALLQHHRLVHLNTFKDVREDLECKWEEETLRRFEVHDRARRLRRQQQQGQPPGPFAATEELAAAEYLPPPLPGKKVFIFPGPLTVNPDEEWLWPPQNGAAHRFYI